MKITYREAMRQALHEALSSDPRVFLMGEDVGKYGGTYAVSKGFYDEFGPERIRDTPLSESAFTGAGIGSRCFHASTSDLSRYSSGSNIEWARKR